MPQCEVYSVAFIGHNIPSIKRNVLGIEMTRCLGVLAVPPEAPSLAPSTKLVLATHTALTMF